MSCDPLVLQLSPAGYEPAPSELFVCNPYCIHLSFDCVKVGSSRSLPRLSLIQE